MRAFALLGLSLVGSCAQPPQAARTQVTLPPIAFTASETKKETKKEPIVYSDRLAYAAEIRTMIRRHLMLPRNVPESTSAVVEFTLSEAGAVAHLRTVKASGSPAYDAAIERAIHLAQPYPLLVVPSRQGPMPIQLRFGLRE
jgi:TonB family protein